MLHRNPVRMKAVVFDTFGDPSVLHITDRDIPPVSSNEVLIRVVAAGINRPDIAQRKGKYPAPAGVVQNILGLEVSGRVEAVGTSVENWKAGDSVCALVPGGGYAEYVAADAGSCLPVPRGISLEDAASLPEVLFTVWHNVFQRGGLKRDEDVLIYGGSGGIGSMAIRLVSLYGANAIALAGSEGKGRYCVSLGAKRVINYREERLLDVLGTNSVDLILDSVGGEYLAVNLDLLKEDGRMVYINAMEGARADLDILKVMRKRLHITGSTLRPRSLDFKKMLAEDILKHAFPLLESKDFKSMVKYKFPLKKAAEAHSLMESRDFTGKIILTTGN